MDQKIDRFEFIALVGIVCAVFVALLYFIPWESVTWGRLKLLPGDTVTVVGEAKTQQENQRATFSAGVSSVSDDKNAATAEVNRKTQMIIEAVKTFGVSPADIKTQNLNVYQSEETYYEDNRQKVRLGQWHVNNTVEITLRDVARSGALADLLTASGATNIYGPNFAVDDTNDVQTSLLSDALKNAKDKAQKIAAASGRKLGKVVSIVEGYQPAAIEQFGGGGGGGLGGGGGVEIGTKTVVKNVTVTYQLIY